MRQLSSDWGLSIFSKVSALFMVRGTHSAGAECEEKASLQEIVCCPAHTSIYIHKGTPHEERSTEGLYERKESEIVKERARVRNAASYAVGMYKSGRQALGI